MITDKVYIVIVTYNAMKWLENCLAGIDSNYCAVVIDNGSEDETLSFIEKNYPSIIVFKQKKNLGFGQANNIGIQYAYSKNADFVMLLNQDVYLNKNTIPELIKIAKKNEDYGILSPIHLNGKGDYLDYSFSKYVSVENCKNFYSDGVLQNYKQNIYELLFVNAAAWLISRKCIEEVGGFSPSFFHYGEDENYCQRALYHNFKIGIVPNVFVYHDREQRPKSSYFTDSKIYYKRMIIFEISNPFSKISKKKLYKREYKGLYLSLLTINFKNIKNYIHNINVLKSINFNQIEKNKNKTLYRGTTFLNENNI